MKVCRRCGVDKPLSDYIKGHSYADGFQPWCSDCRRAYRSGRRDHQRELERAARYGISPESQRELFAAQAGRCAACKDAITYDKAHLDHCHTTLAVRGFLCGSCNRTLGHALESEARLIALVGYLQTHAGIQRDYEAHDPTGPSCRNDHPWLPETTYVHPSGQRHCILCRRESDRRRSRKAVSA